MRLLFDEQLSEELVTTLRDIFPDSLHIRLLGKSGSPDPEVWQMAIQHGCSRGILQTEFTREA